jgi:demethylmenaquinone methyltransferase/2-methoxy-6-polyprenyl-1,4-benzoquinol methylase
VPAAGAVTGVSVSRAIKAMYARIDRGYELVNHLFSFGLDVSWRRRAARRATDRGGARWLDLCTGTGEMASELARSGAAVGALVVGTDFSLPMLRVAKAKRADESGVSLVLADARELPFADGAFDVVTISFATRNLRDGPLGPFFAEVLRVLAAGGRFVHLETSQPESRFVKALFRLYVRSAITPLGVLVTGAAGPYRFLTRSVERFFGRDEFAAVLLDAGFESVSSETVMLGAVAIHEAVKG